VKFFFIYKTLAHPELVGNYIQPITLEERLGHVKQAQKQLGATVPWIVDAMDNRLKHALGDRPNSEFIIDPKGKIVVKRAWSFPAEVRKDLEKLVGKPDRVTNEADIKLKIELPLKAVAERGVVPRIVRPRMQAVVMEPQIEKKGLPFYAKLRAEANPALLNDGKGKLYLGFHLDPFHEAHWNNLTKPLRYEIELPAGAKIDKATGEAEKVKAVSDTDPREFLLDVESWPAERPLKITVTYSACVGDLTCHAVKQTYVLRRKRDIDGGGARGEGAGFWDGDEFARQAMAGDRNGDGKLSKAEVRGLVLPHFNDFDANKDGFLDMAEMKTVAKWLNSHHAPGVPEKPR
jgi:EF hand